MKNLKNIGKLLLVLLLLSQPLFALTTSETEQLEQIYSELTISWQNQTNLLASSQAQIKSLEQSLSNQEALYQNLNQSLKIQSQTLENSSESIANLQSNQSKLKASYSNLENSLTKLQEQNKQLITYGISISVAVIILLLLT